MAEHRELPLPTLLDRLVRGSEPLEAVNVPDASDPLLRRVLRDLGWLLATANRESQIDLSRYPFVRESVLNFGVRALEGRMMSTLDPGATASALASAIGRFEPRLRRVRVEPIPDANGDVSLGLSFRIVAQLHGGERPVGLVLRTRLRRDSGAVELELDDGDR